jgi:predicted PurR-regulated permease PerM
MQYGRSTSWTRSLPLLTTLVSATVVVAILRLARPVLMPIAFAAFLAFILTSPVKWLQHRITRIPALALVMLLAVGAIGSATWVLTSQLNELTAQFGTYAESMRRKVTALQDRSGWPFARVDAMLDQVTGGLEKGAASGGAPVRVVPARATPAAQLWGLVTPLAEPLLTVLFVVVLCIFILGQREDLRNRLIRLIGTANVTLTTRAMDEGAQRITRFLLAQTIINASFGTIVGVALYFVGLPYAVLWGALAAIARFIPYLGAMASMLLPTALAFAIFPGWTQLVLTVGIFLGLDTITAYAVEPLLIGRRTGVSSIALLISALFWVWLWGPLGLALATPMTVSLAVLGRHVPGLQFVAVLLGDDQVIGTEISFYQRLLARDDDEAGEVVRANLASLGPVGVMDKILIPTLVLAARDESRREIIDEDETFIVAAARDIFEHLPRTEPTASGSAASPMRALGIAAYPAQSELLLDMLAAQLLPEHGALEILPRATTPAQAVARVELLDPIVVCIAALPPDGGPFARELCHRLKGRFPALTVVVFRPDEPGVDPARAAKRLKEAGADLVVTTVAEASAEVTRLLGPAPAAS